MSVVFIQMQLNIQSKVGGKSWVNLSTISVCLIKVCKGTPLKSETESPLGTSLQILKHLTISRRSREDYKSTFTEPKATNCFSMNFQVFTNNN